MAQEAHQGFFQKVKHIAHKDFDEKTISTSKALNADNEKLSTRIST